MSPATSNGRSTRTTATSGPDRVATTDPLPTAASTTCSSMSRDATSWSKIEEVADVAQGKVKAYMFRRAGHGGGHLRLVWPSRPAALRLPVPTDRHAPVGTRLPCRRRCDLRDGRRPGTYFGWPA